MFFSAFDRRGRGDFAHLLECSRKGRVWPLSFCFVSRRFPHMMIVPFLSNARGFSSFPPPRRGDNPAPATPQNAAFGRPAPGDKNCKKNVRRSAPGRRSKGRTAPDCSIARRDGRGGLLTAPASKLNLRFERHVPPARTCHFLNRGCNPQKIQTP